MSSAVASPLVHVFIPEIAAIGLDIAQLASSSKAASSRVARLSYRFTYRMSREGCHYGCRVKTSSGMLEQLAERLLALIEEATLDGDSAMLIGCATALEAIGQQTVNNRAG